MYLYGVRSTLYSLVHFYLGGNGNASCSKVPVPKPSPFRCGFGSYSSACDKEKTRDELTLTKNARGLLRTDTSNRAGGPHGIYQLTTLLGSARNGE